MVNFVEAEDSATGDAVEATVEVAERNEDILNPEIQDDRLVKVALKIRDAIATQTKEFEAAKKVLDSQLERVQQELINRLKKRGATQTKTAVGTAFLSEKMQASIADESLFETFVLAQNDIGFLQKRPKLERLKEYMEANEGRLPPGINIFREVTLNIRRAS